MKKINKLLAVIIILTVVSVTTVSSTGESLVINRESILANFVFSITASGLDYETYYVVTLDGVLFANKSTTYENDILILKCVVGADKVDTMVTFNLMDSTGSVILASVTKPVRDILDDVSPDMFSAVLSAAFVMILIIGLPVSIFGAIARRSSYSSSTKPEVKTTKCQECKAVMESTDNFCLACGTPRRI